MKSLVERTRVLDLLRREPGWLLRAGMIASAVVALALLVIVRLGAPSPTSTSALIGRPAYSFTLPVAQSGKLLSSPTHFAGVSAHPTLLVFFNTLCVHCLNEVDAARQAAVSDTSGSFNVIFIDTPGENAQITGAYMARLRLDPPVLLDVGGAVSHEYGASYNPTLVVVDAAGVIRGVWVGETPSATLIDEIRRALAA